LSATGKIAASAVRAARVLALGCVVLLAPLGGCLFEPREAEPPTTSTVQYLPQTSPANVWRNAQSSLEAKDPSGWDESFSEQFIYLPDTDTVNAYPGVDWLNWNKDKEISFINRWYSSDVTIIADLRDTDINTADPSGTTAEWQLIYYVREIQNSNGNETRYRAQATINFQLEANFWYITGWEDEAQESDPDDDSILLPTMGRLRGAFGR
jgi:hypothetical protein